MQSHVELLSIVRDLKASRKAKRKEEVKEAARLETLKARLRIKLNRYAQLSKGTAATKTA